MSHDEMIAVIQAHRDGKEIQLRWHQRSNETWITICPHPNWYFADADYRIKPEPREWWIFPMARGQDNQNLYELGTQARAVNMAGVIHVREVLPNVTQ